MWRLLISHSSPTLFSIDHVALQSSPSSGYVSNVSIIFYCSMLYYLLFWTILGFIIHFYIIFGTNLLTEGPAQICFFFCLFQCFEEKEYQTESKRNEINWRSYFLKESYQKSLECTSGKEGGGHEGGGALPPRARPLPRGPPEAPPTYFFHPYIPTYPKTSEDENRSGPCSHQKSIGTLFRLSFPFEVI